MLTCIHCMSSWSHSQVGQCKVFLVGLCNGKIRKFFNLGNFTGAGMCIQWVSSWSQSQVGPCKVSFGETLQSKYYNFVNSDLISHVLFRVFDGHHPGPYPSMAEQSFFGGTLQGAIMLYTFTEIVCFDGHHGWQIRPFRGNHVSKNISCCFNDNVTSLCIMHDKRGQG